jgi:malonyl-CoA/methylmalonyl-CoA synthetase
MAPTDPTDPGAGLALFARAARNAERTAVLAPEGRFTYRDLLVASGRAAARVLAGRPDLEGARVAFLVSPGFRWTAVQWGTWRAGGVAVPLALQQPARELEYVIRDSGAAHVVAEASLAGPLRELAVGSDVVFTDVDDLLSSDAQASVGECLPALTGERAAMILYTSGTTGRPKGVVTTHANIEAQVGSLVDAWRWRPDDHVLLVLPLHHVHGIVNVLTCALWSGARCSMLPRFEAEGTWERIAKSDLTLFMAVPAIYQRLIAVWDASDQETRERWSAGARALRLCVSGSAALPAQVLGRWEAITGQRLLERYGMTEIGMALSNPLEGERRPGRVGAPLPRVEVRLVDDHEHPVQGGASGEIQVRGPTVFREYWRRPEETRAAFTADGWFRTGDVAACEEGSYRILGRASVDIVKTGGEKVSALEVEEVLRGHPAVADCAVVGVADVEWGERLCAAVVPNRAAAALTLDALRAWARSRLSPWKIPRSLESVEALPRNAMGKVDKAAVRALFTRS